ncbi:ribosomal protein S18-alanine N-acetyltransferase [Proteinivorax hydrogeniformans]|uniref:Ribosomal protein S18-alanine N-acetyltransferase n=1 Tax=Proteinivorax hydrogeniformans TaxID=1826727 RepID=A0AAU8HSX4_9FIRM
MGQYIIVPMTEIHIPAVHEIEKEVFPTPWSEEAFKREINDNHLAHYLVVTFDDKPVGFIGGWFILDECHITNVAVLPSHRRKGLAKALIKALLDLCLAKGVVSVTLEVRESNHKAQNLYKGMGFEVMGVRKGYYTDNNEDALLMWLTEIKEVKADVSKNTSD